MVCSYFVFPVNWISASLIYICTHLATFSEEFHYFFFLTFEMSSDATYLSEKEFVCECSVKGLVLPLCLWSQIVRIRSMTKQGKVGRTLAVTTSPCSIKIIMMVGIATCHVSWEELPASPIVNRVSFPETAWENKAGAVAGLHKEGDGFLLLLLQWNGSRRCGGGGSK